MSAFGLCRLINKLAFARGFAHMAHLHGLQGLVFSLAEKLNCEDVDFSDAEHLTILPRTSSGWYVPSALHTWRKLYMQ